MDLYIIIVAKQIWIGIADILLNMFTTFGSVLGDGLLFHMTQPTSTSTTISHRCGESNH